MRKLLTGLTLTLGILGACNVVEAATISVDANLSHTDLSFSKPIDFTVRFLTTFTSIDLLTIDAFWIGDGLDGGDEGLGCEGRVVSHTRMRTENHAIR